MAVEKESITGESSKSSLIYFNSISYLESVSSGSGSVLYPQLKNEVFDNVFTSPISKPLDSDSKISDFDYINLSVKQNIDNGDVLSFNDNNQNSFFQLETKLETL
ncbi:hypothetical protein NE237_004895 [Protea cynaroides]|uniref:Uncharacterized protein n=1 Tax=Protea cynaroides TaxID=273540 RepID=A0A9Q0KKD5_9MAGN|nr:hypothetical protein NE237_004895 [Protea cynaroides]